MRACGVPMRLTIEPAELPYPLSLSVTYIKWIERGMEEDRQKERKKEHKIKKEMSALRDGGQRINQVAGRTCMFYALVKHTIEARTDGRKGEKKTAKGRRKQSSLSIASLYDLQCAAAAAASAASPLAFYMGNMKRIKKKMKKKKKGEQI